MSVEKLGRAEFVEKKSRFIGYAKGALTKLEAEIFLEDIQQKHPDSNMLYGYVCDYNGNTQKYYDSHEPQGGMAILDSIKKRKLICVVCAVVRYYGGLHLGAGPLGRAFGRAATLAIDDAKPVTFYKSFMVEITIGYSYIGKVEYFFSNSIQKIISKEFGNVITLRTLTKREDSVDLKNKLMDITSGNIKYNIIEELYSPWD